MWEVDELPAGELGAVGEIDIFGEGIVLPAACGIDGLFSPEAGGAVEVDPTGGAVSRGVFDDEVSVEEDGLAAGEEGIAAVEVFPACLDHADAGVGEVVDGFVEEVFFGDEVGIEDGDEVGFDVFHGVGEGAGFEALAVGSVEIGDVIVFFLPGFDVGLGEVCGDIGRVVEDLDLEEVFGVVELAGGVDDSFNDAGFVEHGELDGDAGK